jgi:hypothetical protein
MTPTQEEHRQPEFTSAVTKPSEVTVYSTFDYDSFSFIDQNRKVEHKVDVKQSVEKIGPQFDAFPILVRWDEEAGKLEILDGQARFAVAKEMGEPIYFICKDLPFHYVPVFNSKTTTWEPKDYLNWFCTIEEPEYLKLEQFREKHGHLSLNFVRDYGMQGSRKKIRESFRSGSWSFDKPETLNRVGEMARDFEGLIPSWRHRAFHETLMHMVALEQAPKDETVPTRYDHQHMISQLKGRNLSFEKSHGVLDNMKEFQRIFRYGQSGWKSKVVFEPQYAEDIQPMMDGKLE